MTPCRLIALQSVSTAPGKSMPVKVNVSARALGTLSVRKTKTVKQMRSNKLVLYFRMSPPEVWAHHAMQAVFPGHHRDFRLGSRFSRHPGTAFRELRHIVASILSPAAQLANNIPHK